MPCATAVDHRRVALGHQRQHLHDVADLVVEFRALALQPVEDRDDLALHVADVFFEQEAPVDGQPAGIRHVGRGQAGTEIVGLAAMDRVDVHGRAPAPSGTTGMRVCLRSSAGKQLVLEGVQHRAHVAHRAVAEERHRAVRDLALGLDLGPPDAAMAEADAVLVERLGDDDVVDARLREIALAAPDRRRRRSRRIPRRPCRKSRSRRENPDRRP